MHDWLDRFRQDIADRYQLEHALGHGGMATVYLAQDVRHHRSVALKVLRPDAAQALGHARFLREIAIVAPLVHPNIVSLLDSGEATDMSYFVMPYFPGESLRARLSREGALPVADTVRLARGILAALAYAHDLGIVHRDIKPENILLAGGEAQVADFGIARAVADAADQTRLTGTGLAIGTVAYMAPEQAAGDPQADQRVDLYALGLVWYEMLAGAHPFAGLSPQQQLSAHLVRSIEPLRTIRPGVPAAIDAIVMRCLEKGPADRWQQASDIVRQLDALLVDDHHAETLRHDPAPRLQAFRLGEGLVGRLTSGFDPRMPGDTMRYLDNGRISDVLVCYITRWSIDAEDGGAFLRQTPYRAVSPALFGFDHGRKYRVSLPVDDHLILLGAMLEELVAQTGARHVVLVGFSNGADLVMRLAAADAARVAARIDGVLAMGGNLSRETAFLSARLAALGDAQEDDVLPFLRVVQNSQSSLQSWLDVSEYLVRLVRRFRDDFGLLRDFAQDIAGPFETSPLTSFVEWYRAASTRGRVLRCVFEDDATCRGLVRQLLVGQKERQLLGTGYQPGSLVIEAGTGHFDLEDPELLHREVEAILERVRGVR